MAEMRIDLKLTGLGGVGSGLASVLNSYRKIAAAQEKVIANAAQIGGAQNQLAPTGGFGAATGGVGAPARATVQAASGPASGPMARYLKAREELSRALLRGTSAEVFDAQSAVERTRAAVDKARSRLNGATAGPKLASSSGPFAGLLAARKALFETMNSGDAAAIADAQLRYQRATQQAQRATKALTPASFSDRLGDVLKTSRISLGSGGGAVMPLLGKLAGLAGGTGTGPDPFQFLAARSGSGSQSPLPMLPRGPQPGGRLTPSGAALPNVGKMLPAAARPGGLVGGLGGLMGSAGRGIAGALGGIGQVAGGAIGALGGIAAAAGPVGIALGVVTSVAQLFSAGLSQAVGAISDFRSALRQSGGSVGDVSKLTALGFDPKEIASTAASFRESTSIGSGDIMAQIGRSRLGLGTSAARPFGKTDEAGDLLRAIEGLRKIQNPNERLQLARMTHTEGLLKIAELPERPFREMMRDAETTRQIQGDPRAGQAAGEFDANMGRVGRNAGLLVTSLFKPFIEPFGAFLGRFANLLRAGAEVWDKGPGKLFEGIGRFTTMFHRTFERVGQVIMRIPFVRTIGGLLLKMFEGIGKALEGFANQLPDFVIGVAEGIEGLGDLIDAVNGDAGNPFKSFTDDLIREMKDLKAEQNGDLKRALEKNAQATDSNTNALKGMGTYGGGSRAQAALSGPARIVDPEFRRQYLREQVRSLGFWGR